ncbi:hypothetical protein LL972_21475, partial [Xanthomonas campestris pv. asclepiadis]|uniref:hypothetical protein n=1 Tax=Xanthomonas campestris TaxID=339 RepID=UPI001E5DA5EC
FEADLADTGEIFFGADVDGVAHGVELLQRGEGRRKGVANQWPVTQRGDRARAPPPRRQRARSISAGDKYGRRA